LTGSLDFMQQMQEYDYSEIFEKLRK
jgi:hypothetical protein